MARQETFKIPKPEPKARSLHETIVSVLKRYGPHKQGVLAKQLDASESHLCEVMRGQKHWPEDWLEYVVKHYDFENEIASCVAEWRGLVVRAPRVKSPQERLRRTIYVLKRHNALGDAILAEAEALPDDVFADEEEENPQ